MSETSVIREFLVSIGFKIDETGAKKFDQGIAKATKAAAKFASELALVEGAVVAAVTKVASQFEDLYYASQRLNSSVQNIRGFGYAISQMGGDAAGARSALEGLASFMRSNPSGERFISSLGVSTRDANGQLRDTAEILGDLGKRFAAMPYYIAKIRAQMLGIDEKTLQALIRGVDDFSDHYHDMAKRVGVDQQEAAKAGHDFMVQIRDLGAYLQLLAEKYLLQAMGPIEDLIKGLAALDRATGGVSTALIALGVVLAPLLLLVDPLVIGVGLLAAGLVALWSSFQAWKSGASTLIDWSQWSDQIDQAVQAFQPMLEAFKELGEGLAWLADKFIRYLGPSVMDGIHGAVTLVIDTVRMAGDVLRVVADLLTGRWSKAWTDAGKAVRDFVGSVLDPIRTVTKAVADLWYTLTHHGQAPPAQAPTGPSAQARSDASGSAPEPSAPPYGPGTNPGPWGPRVADAGKQALAFFMSQGWTKAQAAGIVAQGQAESGLNARAVGDNGQARGAFQWHPDRQADFARWAGHDLGQSSLAEQLRFVQFELTKGAYRAVGDQLRRSTNAAEAGALLSRDYEKPRNTLGEMGSRARLAMDWMQRTPAATAGGPQQIVIAPHTDITVHAVDARAAGQEVGKVQTRVNADLLRNTKGALV